MAQAMDNHLLNLDTKVAAKESRNAPSVIQVRNLCQNAQ
jgi:hypothetical protein